MKQLCYHVLTMAVILSGSTAAFAQSEIITSRGENKSKAMQIAHMSKELVNYGQENEDPYTLVAAAKMLMQFKAEDAGNRVEASEGKSDASKDKTKGAGIEPIDLNASAILAHAEAYAERNSSIMQVIADLKKQVNRSSRGYAQGKGYIKATYTIPAYGSRDFKWEFTGDEFAEILFVGDTDTNIDVYVYDSKSGEQLGKDESSESGAYFSWTPSATKTYTFRVVNKGGYDNSTYIMSN